MFQRSDDRWSFFYERFRLDPLTPNPSGWSASNCVLPTHPKRDSQHKAAINLESGSYKCWNATCHEDAIRSLGKRPTSKILTPREFLIISQGFTEYDAEKAVEAYREANLAKDVEGNPGLFGHDDNSFTNAFSPLPPHIAEAIEAARDQLDPELDIVQEYTNTRGITYETLHKAGAGYLPESEGQEECLLLPYYLNGQIVGVRGRTIDGRKGGIKGSYQILYNLDSIQDGAQTVVVVEGETDTLYTTQILVGLGHHIPVVGVPGVEFKHEWRRHLSGFRRIIAIPQDDRAAQRFIENLRKEFADRLEVVALPWRARQHGKDIADFCRLDPQNAIDLVELMGLSKEDETPRPYLLTDSDLKTQAEREIPWLIPDVLERGTKTLLIGAPKTRKTWLCLDMARSLTLGEPFMGLPHWKPSGKYRVVLVEEEGSTYRLGKRWAKVCPDFNDNFFVIHKQQIRLDDVESITQLKQELIPLRPDLIIFDPYANLHLQDENQAQGTMIVMSAINSIMRSLPDTTILIVHHTTKNGETPRGSSALWANVDAQIQISRSKDDVVTLLIEGRELLDENDVEFAFDSKLGRHTPIGDPLVIIPKQPPTTHADRPAPAPLGTQVSKPDKYTWLLRVFLADTKEVWTVAGLVAETSRAEWEVRNALGEILEQLEIIGGGGRRGPKQYRLKGTV